jgi:transcriptional regulator with XRE-family HTH domain
MINDISKTIKETREAYGESQEKFSVRIGCSRVSLSLYETGDSIPSADKYMKVLQLKEDLATRNPAPKEG